MTQVVLHIGMHKTGSTAIQKRLEANAELLDCHGISFDDNSKNQLKSAAKKRDFKPWSQKLKRARKHNNTLLISNEVLSHLLAPAPNQPGACLGSWLTEAFLNEGCSVTLIAHPRSTQLPQFPVHPARQEVRSRLRFRNLCPANDGAHQSPGRMRSLAVIRLDP